jgi:hypothetical protein
MPFAAVLWENPPRFFELFGSSGGGPHYVPRFATEKTVTVNTTAAGGNASLLTLGECLQALRRV